MTTLDVWGHVSNWGWVALAAWGIGCGLAGYWHGRRAPLERPRHRGQRLSEAEKLIPVFPADHRGQMPASGQPNRLTVPEMATAPGPPPADDEPHSVDRRADRYRLAWLSARRRATLAAFGYTHSAESQVEAQRDRYRTAWLSARRRAHRGRLLAHLLGDITDSADGIGQIVAHPHDVTVVFDTSGHHDLQHALAFVFHPGGPDA